MTSATIVSGLVLAALAANARSQAAASSGGPDSQFPRAAIRSDVAGSLFVDGRRVASVAPGVALPLALEPGEHIVQVTSAGGEARWEMVIDEGRLPAGAELLVELASVVETVRRDYVRLPGGTFEMGCVVSAADCIENEKPRHTVSISRDFWMMRTEVTVGAYKAAARQAGEAMPEATDVNPDWGLENHPMMNVTWAQAADYCEGVGGRLPTEAEWEYGARGGRGGGKYVWGNAAVPLVDGRKQANVGDLSTKKKVGCPMCGFFETYDDGYHYTAPVASFVPNGFGLYDMSGNVEEWCADWYRDRSYDGAPAADPPGSPYGRWRVLRGGSWSIGPSGHRVSGRGGFPPDRTNDNYGIRCVRDIFEP